MQFFKQKLSGIDIEKDKISKFFQFSLLLLNLCQNIDRLRGLEISVSFCYEISSIYKRKCQDPKKKFSRKMPQIDMNCQKIRSFEEMQFLYFCRKISF